MKLGPQPYLIGMMLAVSVVSLTGCGGRKTHQVTGRAQYNDGSPIQGAVRVIRLEPAEDTTAEIRKVANGELSPDGSFEMYTRVPGDGVIPGKYVVTFTVMDKAMGGKSLIPTKYTNVAESPFKVEIDGSEVDLLYELEKK